MFFDDTRRQAEGTDHWLVGIADHLRDHMLSQEEPLSETLWRIAGHRFARALAQERPAGISCVRQFAEGMRSYCNESHTMSLGGPILYDVNHNENVEEKAEKLLALATHKTTGEAEARAALAGLMKLFKSGDLAIIGSERLSALRRSFSRMEEMVNFLKREHPTLFLFAPDESNPGPIQR